MGKNTFDRKTLESTEKILTGLWIGFLICAFVFFIGIILVGLGWRQGSMMMYVHGRSHVYILSPVMALFFLMLIIRGHRVHRGTSQLNPKEGTQDGQQ